MPGEPIRMRLSSYAVPQGNQDAALGAVSCLRGLTIRSGHLNSLERRTFNLDAIVICAGPLGCRLRAHVLRLPLENPGMTVEQNPQCK